MADWTILKLIEWTTEYFTRHGVPNPRLDAELLLGHLLSLKRIDLYLKFEMPLSAAELAKFKELVQRRSRREPLQYILGNVDFYGAKICVAQGVLIPRPETEMLVDFALKHIRENKPSGARILDLCTGSGAIIAALAQHLPDAVFIGADISEAAVRMASANTASLNERAKILKSDLFSALTSGEKFDLIVTNPPYVPKNEIATLQEEIKNFEPHLALDGGEDGLDIVTKICKISPGYLSKGGSLFIELGENQAQKVKELLSAGACFENAGVLKDLSGVDRFVFASRRK